MTKQHRGQRPEAPSGKDERDLGALVLIVEDDDDVRSILAEQLNRSGYRTVCVGDGEQGLALLRGGVRPAVIILDLLMPRMSGTEFLVELRRHDTLAQIPVLMMTGGNAPFERPVIVAEVIPKPFGLDRLLDAIRRAMS